MISELGMEQDHAFIHHYQMNPFDYTFDGLNFQSFSSAESYPSYQNLNPKSTHNFSASLFETSQTSSERPTKQLKSNSWNSCTTEHNTPKGSSSSSTSQLISFKNSNSPAAVNQQYFGLDSNIVKPKNEVGSNENMIFQSMISQGSYEDQNQYSSPTYGQVTKRVGETTRTPSHAQDHVLAERKRREKLSQRFIALSAILPGLKKTDKASILGDSIKYLKQLQERVNTLEEQAAKKTMQSVVFVKKSYVRADDESSSTDEKFDDHSEQQLPEIEARVSDKDVLIKIHCEKSKGCIVKILGEIEKLHLTVVNTNVLPFGNFTLDITIVAQMDNEFSMTMKDLLRNLRQALLKFM